MQKTVPCLWYDNKAEEAAKFYVSIFKNSYGEEAAKVSGRPKGTVVTVTFQLDGQEFMALKGGPAILLLASHIVCRELPDAERDR